MTEERMLTRSFSTELEVRAAGEKRLLCGVVVVPLLIWVAGNKVLGGYTHGPNQHAGPGALLGDFFVGLAHGSSVFWLVALGPAIFLTLLRAFVHLLRSGSARDPSPY